MYTKDFTVEIVTPVETKFEGQVQEVILPGSEGEMAVLGGHAPLLTMLDPGVTMTVAGNERTIMSTGGGFATIAENKVVVLVDFACSVDELDFAELAKEADEVQNALSQSPNDAVLRAKLGMLRAKLKAKDYGKN